MTRPIALLCLLALTGWVARDAARRGESWTRWSAIVRDGQRVFINKVAYRLGRPQVFDVVMFYYPLRPERAFVQRVIATEGDQVRIVDGQVYRNDVLMEDSFVRSDFRSHDRWGPQVVREGCYFVMGDHRNGSSDSRHWGFVPKKYIIGLISAGR
jgi:signal peptidase I